MGTNRVVFGIALTPGVYGRVVSQTLHYGFATVQPVAASSRSAADFTDDEIRYYTPLDADKSSPSL